MPIPVVCPGCGARMNAPDSGAGKVVRCPKPDCGARIPVPASAAEGEELPSDASGAERMGESPHRRHGKPLIAVGLVLLLGGVGYGVYAFVSKLSERAVPKGKDAGPSAESVKRAPPPPGWKEYSYPDDNFKAYFPGEPEANQRVITPEKAALLDALGSNRACSAKSYFYAEIGARGIRFITVDVIRYTKDISAEERVQIRKDILSNPATGLKGQPRIIGWLGQEAEEYSSPRMTRIAFVKNTMYMVIVAGGENRRLPEDEENGFFDNFQLLK